MRASSLILLVLILVGCGGAEAEPTGTSPPPVPSGTATPIPSTAASSLPAATPRPPAPEPVSEGSLVITNGTVIDGTGADPIVDGIVIIAGDRITAVGSASDFAIPPAVRVIDAQGGTILPGFINAHIHQGYDEGNLKAWAQGGVTTVRDLLDDGPRQELFSFRDALRDQPQYARLVAAGPAVTVPNGYPMVPWGVPGLTVNSADDAREKVNQLLDDGADLIKIMMESGKTFGRVIPVLSPSEGSAIVQVAHGRGIPVTAHAMDASDLERALDAGVDDVAHMIWDPLPDELVARMVENDVFWVPTLELYRYITRDAQNGWDQKAIGNLRRFVAGGGKVALGTDFAGYGAEYELAMPMLDIHSMQEAGMTPMQIIVAATRNAAHVGNLGSETGTLEAGKKADILVVDGDPLTNIRALARTTLVLRDGIVIRQ